MPLPPHHIPSCPFCEIANAYPPSSSSSPLAPPPPTPHRPLTASSSLPPRPLAHVLLSTPQLIAFLDHAPIARGHVLIATRQHREKLSDISVDEGRAVGAWMGIISRAVVRSVLARTMPAQAGARPRSGVRGTRAGSAEGEQEEESDDDDDAAVGDWNIVQNNGARAAQVVPHVHFHIIPRPGDVPEIKNRSWTVFGKGQREELDEEEAEDLVKGMREQLALEIERVRLKEGEEGLRILMGEEGGQRGRETKL